MVSPWSWAMIYYRRNFVSGASYFFTVNLADRKSNTLVEHIGELRAAFRYVRQRHPFALDAIVVLPDHLHAIWTLPDGDPDFPVRWRLIKSAFSRALPTGEKSRPAGPPKASAVFGSDDIGNTRCGMSRISSGTSIISISTRSSMDLFTA
jgi:REP element-mobilizing transposase RayT